ncbi:MAG: SCO family protein [Leptospiraceae bacterium]|nr:SCO family protein [Leptospiraceae bacterium]MCK6380193.1 SCO family protein [Leptospiraceae bacterium]NUM42589.1 SCO family protein [Leptospiraceae bacterium]
MTKKLQISILITTLLFSFCKKEESEISKEPAISPYVLESVWKDQNGKEMKLKELMGNLVFISMFYSSCNSVCPRIVSDIKKLEKSLSKSTLKKSKFVMVSLDEEKDSPEKMKAYIEKMQLNESRWILLSGNKDAIRELSIVLETDFKKMDDGEISHSAIVTLISEKGNILAKEKGIGGEFSEIQKKIQLN